MGVFAEWQPRYAEHGISTFPVSDDKTPAITNYQKVGLPASGQLTFKFPDIENFGFLAGKRSNLTVIDVDTNDENIWREAERTWGPTPLWVRTSSGRLHMYYKYGGEKRDVKSKFLGCVDVLGGGQVLAFPSKWGQGYQAIRGSLADIHSLPAAHIVHAEPATQSGSIQEGKRNGTLFEHLMREVRHVDQFDQLLDVARTFTDDEFVSPISDAELIKTAQSVWGYESKGFNKFGSASTLNVAREVVLKHAAQNPNAFALFSFLQTHHKGLRDEFKLANAMAESIGWPLRRLKAATGYLVDEGLLKCVSAGGRGRKDTPVYRF